MSLSLSSRHFLSTSPPRISTSRSSLYLKNPYFHFQILPLETLVRIRPFPLKSYESDPIASTSSDRRTPLHPFDLDRFLLVAESLCISSSAIVSAVFAAKFVKSEVLSEIGRRVLLFGVVGLVGGVAIGIWIRRRQRRRAWRENVRGQRMNLVERVEILEEDLKSTATMVRVVSKQLEKLGLRFRVTRKALKEPISEMAALAQKNSEATRALAAREDVLEKELCEIQKVLLAMQEQQQKQLDLILAIVKGSELWESKQVSNEQQDITNVYTSTPKDEQAGAYRAQVTNKDNGINKETVLDSEATNPV